MSTLPSYGRRRILAGLVALSWIVFSEGLAGHGRSVPTLAVLKFQATKVDSADVEILRDAIQVELQKSRRVRVMERSQINQILSEQSFQNSGSCDQSECAVEVGKLLAVDRVVLGTVGRIGESWSISLRVVGVQSGEVIASSRDARMD